MAAQGSSQNGAFMIRLLSNRRLSPASPSPREFPGMLWLLTFLRTAQNGVHQRAVDAVRFCPNPTCFRIKSYIIMPQNINSTDASRQPSDLRKPL